jgi:hypothetical protein
MIFARLYITLLPSKLKLIRHVLAIVIEHYIIILYL